jgi:Fic family protein
MPWNWELPDWPNFTFDPHPLSPLDKKFLLGVGNASAHLKIIDEEEYRRFIVEILSLEGVESARIEGEILDRESLQSSIKKHFGFATNVQPKGDILHAGSFLNFESHHGGPSSSHRSSPILRQYGSPRDNSNLDHPEASKIQESSRVQYRESRMAELLCDVYATFDEPLTHEMLWRWHAILFKGVASIEDYGKYRSHPEPMQIVSNRYGSSRVFFEAPPSSRVIEEMTQFIDWFNGPNKSGSILGQAALAHVYFESIHPFEDGNGRIGRVLVEKILAQSVGRSVLIAVSRVLEKKRKEYYFELGKCNGALDVQDWVEFFAKAIVQAQEESLNLLYFLIAKSKMLNSLAGQLNDRQEKVLLRLFAEGPNGFVGGLNAEKYVTITKTSRATATRDLADLVQKGALRKTGELRHTRYWLNIPTAL